MSSRDLNGEFGLRDRKSSRTVGSDAAITEVIELLPSHFNQRHDADVGLPRSQLIGAHGGHSETQVEDAVPRRVAQQTPDQGDSVEIAHRAHPGTEQ